MASVAGFDDRRSTDANLFSKEGWTSAVEAAIAAGRAWPSLRPDKRAEYGRRAGMVFPASRHVYCPPAWAGPLLIKFGEWLKGRVVRRPRPPKLPRKPPHPAGSISDSIQRTIAGNLDFYVIGLAAMYPAMHLAESLVASSTWMSAAAQGAAIGIAGTASDYLGFYASFFAHMWFRTRQDLRRASRSKRRRRRRSVEHQFLRDVSPLENGRRLAQTVSLHDQPLHAVDSSRGRRALPSATRKVLRLFFLPQLVELPVRLALLGGVGAWLVGDPSQKPWVIGVSAVCTVGFYGGSEALERRRITRLCNPDHPPERRRRLRLFGRRRGIARSRTLHMLGPETSDAFVRLSPELAAVGTTTRPALMRSGMVRRNDLERLRTPGDSLEPFRPEKPQTSEEPSLADGLWADATLNVLTGERATNGPYFSGCRRRRREVTEDASVVRARIKELAAEDPGEVVHENPSREAARVIMRDPYVMGTAAHFSKTRERGPQLQLSRDTSSR